MGAGAGKKKGAISVRAFMRRGESDGYKKEEMNRCRDGRRRCEKEDTTVNDRPRQALLKLKGQRSNKQIPFFFIKVCFQLVAKRNSRCQPPTVCW